MKNRNTVRYAISTLAAMALLAGCSNGGPQLGPGAMQQSAPQTGTHNPSVNIVLSLTRTTPRNVKYHGKVMRPNCCSGYAKILYVSDQSQNAVLAYSYPEGTLLGALPQPPEGFNSPDGLCIGKRGALIVTNTGNSTIDLYSHSGTFLRELTDTDETPVGCAYDRLTHTLAVSNVVSASGQGGISLYANASGSPTVVKDPTQNLYLVYFLGYDDTGTLWIDGEQQNGLFSYDKYSGGTFTPITISGANILQPGTVEWSGKTQSMNVGDQHPLDNAVYQVNSTGQVTGTTPLDCPTSNCSYLQASIKGSRLVAPDSLNGGVYIYKYPKGGANIMILTGTVMPIGTAISNSQP